MLESTKFTETSALFEEIEANNYIKLLEGEILEISDMQDANINNKTTLTKLR